MAFFSDSIGSAAVDLELLGPPHILKASITEHEQIHVYPYRHGCKTRMDGRIRRTCLQTMPMLAAMCSAYRCLPRKMNCLRDLECYNGTSNMAFHFGGANAAGNSASLLWATDARPFKPRLPCAYFQSGSCSKGDRCTFSHDPAVRQCLHALKKCNCEPGTVQESALQALRCWLL